jgi:UDP-N-acetylmuramoylalanine--D-glutamate ligase
MPNYDAIFQGKKITQMGLGLLGRGVGDAAFLARHGVDLIVTDMKTEAELAESLALLSKFPNITFHLGGHHEEDFIGRDLILKGAGVPIDSPYIQVAREHGVPVDMSASLFARIADIPMIGVTGTRGKSTVTHLLEKILTTDSYSVLVGGNVRGVSNLALFDDLSPESVGVFELDSWQCQGFGEEKTLSAKGVEQGPRSPQIAVFTTFMSDHLNYYKKYPEAYMRDKANIFLHQTPADTLIVGKQALPVLNHFKKDIQAHVIVADENDVPKGWNVPLVGAHNRYNVGIAIATARAFGVDEDSIRSAVESARPVAGRLELIRTLDNVAIYNDTNATTPDATIAALQALDPENKKRVVLILGGADKELDMSGLPSVIQEHTKACVFLKGTGTSSFLKNHVTEDAFVAENLPEAVQQARKVAEGGDVILFSPAFASFGMFKNEYDRGEQFVQIVQNLPLTSNDCSEKSPSLRA